MEEEGEEIEKEEDEEEGEVDKEGEEVKIQEGEVIPPAPRKATSYGGRRRGSNSKSLFFIDFDKSITTDQPTDGRTDRRTRPLIEMRTPLKTTKTTTTIITTSTNRPTNASTVWHTDSLSFLVWLPEPKPERTNDNDFLFILPEDPLYRLRSSLKNITYVISRVAEAEAEAEAEAPGSGTF